MLEGREPQREKGEGEGMREGKPSSSLTLERSRGRRKKQSRSRRGRFRWFLCHWRDQRHHSLPAFRKLGGKGMNRIFRGNRDIFKFLTFFISFARSMLIIELKLCDFEISKYQFRIGYLRY